MSSGAYYRVALVRTDDSKEHRLHFQGNETLASSQFVARIGFTTAGEDSPFHGTPTVKYFRYRGGTDVCFYLHLYCPP
jgi:hypothetical protein